MRTRIFVAGFCLFRAAGEHRRRAGSNDRGPRLTETVVVYGTLPDSDIGHDPDKVAGSLQSLSAGTSHRRPWRHGAEFAGQQRRRRVPERQPGQHHVRGCALSRLRGLAAAGHRRGHGRLSERRAPQRGLRRHRQLGRHSRRPPSSAWMCGATIRCSASTRWAAPSIW